MRRYGENQADQGKDPDDYYHVSSTLRTFRSEGHVIIFKLKS